MTIREEEGEDDFEHENRQQNFAVDPAKGRNPMQSDN